MSFTKDVTIRFIETYPDHTPRSSDPNYKYFNQAKERLKKAGLMKCVVDSNYHYGQIELHHDKVEFAHQKDVDVTKLNELYGLHLNDQDFQQWIEGEGNLEPLCTLHHRGQEGVHSLPQPEWGILRVAKSPETVLSVQANNLIPVIKTKIS